jgi:hypothetical protein
MKRRTSSESENIVLRSFARTRAWNGVLDQLTVTTVSGLRCPTITRMYGEGYEASGAEANPSGGRHNGDRPHRPATLHHVSNHCGRSHVMAQLFPMS